MHFSVSYSVPSGRGGDGDASLRAHAAVNISFHARRGSVSSASKTPTQVSHAFQYHRHERRLTSFQSMQIYSLTYKCHW